MSLVPSRVVPRGTASPRRALLSVALGVASVLMASGLGVIAMPRVAGAIPPPTNLVSNDGFETPATSDVTTVPAGGFLPGWVVEAGEIDVVAAVHWQPACGTQSLDMDGFTQAGTIFQDLNTIVGQSYTLRFAEAANPDGGPAVKQLQVSFGGTVIDSPSSATGTRRNMGWTYHQYSVTATSTISRLRFASLTPGSFGATLDDVSVSIGARPLCANSFFGSMLFGGSNAATGAPPACFAGEPVNCNTGNLVEAATDLFVRGRGRALNLGRTYNSLDAVNATAPGLFGLGWSSTYGSHAVTDGVGNVTVIQPNGATVTFNPSGSAFTAPSFVTATLSHAGSGLDFTLKNQTVDHFDATGRLVSQTDRNGYLTTLAYDPDSGHLLTVTDPAGRQLRFVTASTGLVTQVTDPLGRVVHYAYDTSNRLITVTDVGGGLTRYVYDAANRMTQMTDPLGHVSTSVYDGADRVTSQTDATGAVTTFAYAGNTRRITDPNGNKTDQVYDNNLLTSITRGATTAGAATVTFGYDAALNRVATTDANGHASSSTFDARANMVSATDALGRVTTATFNTRNDPTSITDPLGIATTMGYDAHGNLASWSRPLTGTGPATTTYGHADAGHPGDLSSITDPLGSVTGFAYDANGDLNRVTDPVGDVATAAYNVVGWLTSATSPRGNVTSMVYDNFGNATATTDPTGAVTHQSYNADRYIATSTDALGHVASYGYDNDNRRTRVTRADGSVISDTYDAGGRMVSQRDALGNTSAYSYDALNRPVTISDELARPIGFVYDPAGNLTRRTDPAGTISTFTYDAANQRSAMSYSDATPGVTYTYDGDGRRATMTDGTGTTTYHYDSLGRLTSQTNGAGKTVSYGYDLRGGITKLTYPDGHAVGRGFDAAGRLTSVADWLANVTTFSYDADSNLVSQTDPNGVVGTNTYDAADRVLSLTDKKGVATLLSFTDTRNAGGQLSAETPTGVPDGATTFSYNALNRLTAGRGHSFGYDGADNLTASDAATLSYDAAHELTAITGGPAPASFASDANGSRTSRTPDAGAVTSYAYDAARRLRSIAGVATYSYNGDGLRMAKTPAAGGASAFSWDQAEGLSQPLTDGTTAFIFGPGGRPIEQVTAGAGTGPPPVHCDHTMTNTYSPGNLTLTGGTWCLNGARVGGNLTVTGGTSAVITGTSIAGSLTATNPGTFSLCGSAVGGNLSVSGAAGHVVIGDPGDDACGGNRIGGNANLSANHAGAELANNSIGGNVTFANNSGAGPFPEDGAPEVEANSISGSLNCPANTPPASTDGQPGRVGGTRSGDCAVNNPPVTGPGATTTAVQFLHADQQGSIRAITDATGAVIATFAYAPYGTVTAHTGTATSPFGFAGGFTDAESGLIYLHARYYDPATGGFLTGDPLAPVTRAPYAYGLGDPVNRIDPTGLGSPMLGGGITYLAPVNPIAASPILGNGFGVFAPPPDPPAVASSPSMGQGLATYAPPPEPPSVAHSSPSLGGGLSVYAPVPSMPSLASSPGLSGGGNPSCAPPDLAASPSMGSGLNVFNPGDGYLAMDPSLSGGVSVFAPPEGPLAASPSLSGGLGVYAPPPGGYMAAQPGLGGGLNTYYDAGGMIAIQPSMGGGLSI